MPSRSGRRSEKKLPESQARGAGGSNKEYLEAHVERALRTVQDYLGPKQANVIRGLLRRSIESDPVSRRLVARATGRVSPNQPSTVRTQNSEALGATPCNAHCKAQHSSVGSARGKKSQRD